MSPLRSRLSASLRRTSIAAVGSPLQFLHLGHHRGAHAAKLGAPLVERLRADAELPAHVGHRNRRLHPLERIHDLAVRKP